MKAYFDLLRHVYEHGQDRPDRTGVGTRGVFGAQMRVNLHDGFPLLTTKKVHLKSIIYELLWFLRGDTNVRFLQENGVTIWDEWADERGELGPVYGKQWRRWIGIREIGKGLFRDAVQIDQITQLIEDLKKNPFSRRHIVSAWNPVDVPRMKLPPCHTLWQCYVSEDRQGARSLDLHLYARSIDIFLGLPFNIASYALLLMMLAQVTKVTAGDLVISFGDLHLYRNHFAQAEEQLSRTPGALPTMHLNPAVTTIDGFGYQDFDLAGYYPLPSIKAPIAV